MCCCLHHSQFCRTSFPVTGPKLVFSLHHPFFAINSKKGSACNTVISYCICSTLSAFRIKFFPCQLMKVCIYTVLPIVSFHLQTCGGYIRTRVSRSSKYCSNSPFLHRTQDTNDNWYFVNAVISNGTTIWINESSCLYPPKNIYKQINLAMWVLSHDTGTIDTILNTCDRVSAQIFTFTVDRQRIVLWEHAASLYNSVLRFPKLDAFNCELFQFPCLSEKNYLWMHIYEMTMTSNTTLNWIVLFVLYSRVLPS